MTLAKKIFIWASGGAAVFGIASAASGATAIPIIMATTGGACLGAQGACAHEAIKNASEFREWRRQRGAGVGGGV